MSEPEPSRRDARQWIARGFGAVEDVSYIGLGLLLACIVVALLVATALHVVQSIMAGSLLIQVTELLDRILLTLLIVELLYTVQVSFREHRVSPEPFLLVGLIAAIRRMLLLTAEYGELHQRTDAMLKAFVAELLVLTVLIVALVVSLILLRKTGSAVHAERA
ncbi:MAG: phosphate-starvation-inducible PsiE family protein [Bacillota bacterium]